MSDQSEGIKRRRRKRAKEERKMEKTKRHSMPLDTILDAFRVSTREYVGLNGLIRTIGTYFDLDQGQREHVSRAVLNLMGNICRKFGNLDSGAILVDVMNHFVGQTVVVSNILKGLRRSNRVEL